jgi:hypothetical protein
VLCSPYQLKLQQISFKDKYRISYLFGRYSICAMQSLPDEAATKILYVVTLYEAQSLSLQGVYAVFISCGCTKYPLNNERMQQELSPIKRCSGYQLHLHPGKGPA